jgi:hypothetical protein
MKRKLKIKPIYMSACWTVSEEQTWTVSEEQTSGKKKPSNSRSRVEIAGW